MDKFRKISCLLFLVSNLLCLSLFANSKEVCASLIGEIYNDSTVYAGCDAGECNSNIHRYLFRLNEKSPETVTDVSVLVIRWKNPNRDLRMKIPVLKARDKKDGKNEFYRHTIAVVKDEQGQLHVVDFDFDSGHRVTPIRDYMQEMFGDQQRYLTVWSVPGTDYLENYAPRAVGEEPKQELANKWAHYYGQRMLSNPPVPMLDFLNQ